MPKKRLILIITAGILLAAVFCGFFIFKNRIIQTRNLLGPAAVDLSDLQRFRILLKWSGCPEKFSEPLNPDVDRFILEIGDQEGVSSVLSDIASELDCDPELLRSYWVYSGADRQIQPGRYVISGSFTVPQLTELLSAAGGSLIRFSFFSGMRLEELAQLIDGSGFSFTGDEFLNAAQNYDPAKHPAGIQSLEGYFVPGSYEMSRSITLDTFLANFVRVFENRVIDPYGQAFTDNGLSLHEAVIMSSMIAREAISESEYGTIASVFYNRIAAGMKFESDPTVQYAVGWDQEENTWWKNPLTFSDLAIYSPYNTYVMDGFPLGPICSPGTDIYETVAYPERTDYYYFRARCDGTPYHNFSRTYEEHVSFACN